MFAIIGAGLKFIDEAFDEDLFSRKLAALLAPILVGLWIYLSIMSPGAATILFAVLVAVLLSGKIDNQVFLASTLLLLMAPIILAKIALFWVPFLILTLLGVLDEKGNDHIDRHGGNSLAEFFFLHRFSMKLGVVGLYLTFQLPWEAAVGFLFFDISYDAVGTVAPRLASMEVPRPLPGRVDPVLRFLHLDSN